MRCHVRPAAFVLVDHMDDDLERARATIADLQRALKAARQAADALEKRAHAAEDATRTAYRTLLATGPSDQKGDD